MNNLNQSKKTIESEHFDETSSFKSDIPLELCVKRYIEFLDIKQISIDSYEKILNHFLNYLKTRCIATPKRADIMKYKDSLRDKYKAATLQKYIVVVRNFFRWYQISGFGLNIADGIKGAKIEESYKHEALSINQLKKLINKVKSHANSMVGKRNYAVIYLLATTGLRTIEVERANLEDLNQVGDNHVLYIQGKGRDEKDIYVKIPDDVYEIIEAYLKERNDNYKPLFLSHSRNSKDGTRMTTKTIRHVVKEYLRLIGIDGAKYSAHSLRHTAATINLLQGATMEETKQLLRHRNISTTLIYSHHLDRKNNDSENRIARAIKGSSGGTKK